MKTRVLIVDESPEDRRQAGAVVETLPGGRALYASGGREALALAAREHPDVILTTLSMSGLDGLELVREVRRRHPGLPVVLMTASGSEDIAIKALHSGAASYVPKGSLARDLPETLAQVLSVASSKQQQQRLLECLARRETVFLVPNDPELIPPLVNLLLEDLETVEFEDETTRIRIGIALQEALSNALFHGNLEVSSDLRQEDERTFYRLADQRRAVAPYRDRRIHVQATMLRDEVTFVIRDQGPGFDTSVMDGPIEGEDVMRIGGRGLLLIRTFMDRVSHSATGNEITMVKTRRRPTGVEGDGWRAEGREA